MSAQAAGTDNTKQLDDCHTNGNSSQHTPLVGQVRLDMGEAATIAETEGRQVVANVVRWALTAGCRKREGVNTTPGRLVPMPVSRGVHTAAVEDLLHGIPRSLQAAGRLARVITVQRFLHSIIDDRSQLIAVMVAHTTSRQLQDENEREGDGIAEKGTFVLANSSTASSGRQNAHKSSDGNEKTTKSPFRVINHNSKVAGVVDQCKDTKSNTAQTNEEEKQVEDEEQVFHTSAAAFDRHFASLIFHLTKSEQKRL